MTIAVASRDPALCSRWCRLRKAASEEEATNNDARLNQLLAWLKTHLRRDPLGEVAQSFRCRCVRCTAS